MNDENIELKTLPIWKLMLKYSIPAIIGMMVNALYTIVDRIFIGNIPEVGALAMVGLGVSMPMVQIINSFGMLLAVGGATTISIKLGQGKSDEAEQVLGNVFSFTALLGLILTIIGIFFLEDILILFGGSQESLPMATSYMSVLLLGTIFSLYGATFSFLIRGDGNPKLSAIMMVLGCLLNIVLDAIFILVFSLGIQGAAIATIISQITTTVIGFTYYLRGKSQTKLKLKNLKLEIPYLKEIVFIGLAPFCTQIAGSLTQIVTNNMLVNHGGDLAIGALSTIMSIIMMLAMPIIGLTTGIQPIISYNFGAKEYKRVIEVIKLAGIVATTFLLAIWLVILTFPEILVSMFNSDPELMAITIDGLKKYCLMLPFLGITYVGTNFIQSTGEAKVALMLSLMRQFLFLIPLLLILPNFLGLDGVWYTQPIADVLSGVISFYVMFKTIKGYGKDDVIDKVT